jgi:glycosyltransferase involved in cell wall biosynthesis
MIKHAIILPLKENFTNISSGAVSIWVDDYLKYSKYKKNIFIITSKKKTKKEKYLSNNNLIEVKLSNKILRNYNYISEACKIIIKKKIKSVEIHNRPEYAIFLVKKIPDIKINLIFHNNPNNLRGSTSPEEKEFLVQKCKNLIFVSEYLKKIFYDNIKSDHKNNIRVIYNSIIKEKRFSKKNNIIVFAGKLNSLKGYHIFLEAVKIILEKFKNWKVQVYGNEPREKHFFKHDRLIIKDWIQHSKLLNIYKKASIAVVNPTWEEPFGRTAMESASKGCAVITSKSGGLQETFHNNLILEKNDAKHLASKISYLISNPKILKKIQKDNFRNPIRLRRENVEKLDSLINYDVNNYKISVSNGYKILHISTFGEKNDYRTFNISISNKISKGFIKNGNDVINYDYRGQGKYFSEKLDNKILNIVNNYKPDLVLLGHNNVLERETILNLKQNSKIALWFEDHLMKGDPSYKKNLDLIEKNFDLIDHYFITTSPDVIKTKINKRKISFLPIPVDPNIEKYNFYNAQKDKDLFFAISHGVNFGKLKKITDEREEFLSSIIKKCKNKIKFHILGYNNEQPKWNYEFNKELMRCKIALNLSRGGPSKYATSNRIAMLVGNGVPTLLTDKIKWSDFFTNKEIIFYKNQNDLIKKVLYYKENNSKLIKIGKKGKLKYFKIFNNQIVSDFILHKTLNSKPKYKYIWDR